MVSLRRMTEEEYRVFFAQLIPDYAAEKVQAGNWTSESALEMSRRELTSLLPRGLASANQHLYTIERDGIPTGRLWLSFEPHEAGSKGFVYDLFVAEPFRRRGVGTEAMRLLEGEAIRLGVTSLTLHVFGFNVAARALYQKLGYEITNINMSKDLGPTPR